MKLVVVGDKVQTFLATKDKQKLSEREVTWDLNQKNKCLSTLTQDLNYVTKQTKRLFQNLSKKV